MRADVLVEGLSVSALIDTGASHSLISSSLFARLELRLLPWDVTLLGADARPLVTLGAAVAAVVVGGATFSWRFGVVQGLGCDLLLACDFLARYRATLSFGKRRLFVPQAPSPVPVVFAVTSSADCVSGVDSPNSGSKSSSATVVSVGDDGVHDHNPDVGISSPVARDIGRGSAVDDCSTDGVGSWTSDGLHTFGDVVRGWTDASWRKALDGVVRPDHPFSRRLRDFLTANRDVFAASPKAPGLSEVPPHVIPLRPDQRPIFQRARRVSPAEIAAQRAEVDMMLAAGVIRPSSSPWSSPVVMVRKKDGSWRFCVDYRRLNDVTVSDRYPLPRIDDILDRVGEQAPTIFSAMDCASGFFQIAVHPDDIPKTAFSTPFGHYEFVAMPFGLKNAPATFQRAIDQVLIGMPGVLAYMDDTSVASPSFEEHLRALAAFFDRVRAVGFQLRLDKCQFAVDLLKFLATSLTNVVCRWTQRKLRPSTFFRLPLMFLRSAASSVWLAITVVSYWISRSFRCPCTRFSKRVPRSAGLITVSLLFRP